MTTTHKATIGSISTGTLPKEDLLQAFADELERIRTSGEYQQDINEARDYLDGNIEYDNPDEIASEIVNDLQDALNEYAPPFCYFGSLEGDGADFGFWPDHEAIQELIRESQMSKGTKPLDQSVEYINVEQSLHILVNDHGNITISTLGPGEVLLSIV